jgi:hypothetical protein
VDVRSINVLTESAHARRTWLLFQEAFGDQVNVGIISARNPDYDPAHWWRSSDGFREVISELVAYLYARFYFLPFETSISGAEREFGTARCLRFGNGAVNAARAVFLSDDGGSLG